MRRHSDRDVQREKLYRSERPIFKVDALKGRKMETVAEVQAYVNKLMASAWFRRHHPRVRFITIAERPRAGRGTAIGSRIELPEWTRFEMYVLHEVAHVIETQRNAGKGTAHHGWEFASIYLELVGHVLGRPSMLALRAAFRENGVRYKAPRQLSPETLAAMRERGRRLAAGQTLDRAIAQVVALSQTPPVVEDDRITSFIERLQS